MTEATSNAASNSLSDVTVSDESVAAFATGLAQVGGSADALTGQPGQTAVLLLAPYLNHAAGMYAQEYATRDDIDAAMRFGCGYQAGPLSVIDAIGAGEVVTALEQLHAVTDDQMHVPAEVLRRMVEAGTLGRSTGTGFYEYAEDGSPVAGEAAGEALAEGRTVGAVGVVGTGTMASGIVEVFAKAGHPVTFVARSDEKVAAVRATLERSLGKAVDRGKLTEADRDEILGRITGTTSREDLASVDLVLEAVAEDLEIKLALFRDFDRICAPGTILATTTSSLPISAMAEVTSRPADVIGMHFFNPATIMRLVEVVSTDATASEVTDTVVRLCHNLGKHPVLCGDRAGFIVNALLFPYLNDAVRLLEADYAPMDEIDETMKAGAGLPMGPFALLDVVGNDVSLAIEQVLYDAFGLPGLAPAPLLEQTVALGHLGRKTSRGFHDYAL